MKKTPIADSILIKRADEFLKTNNLTYDFCSFHSKFFFRLLGSKYSHSDCWAAIYDWLHERLEHVPEGIETALTELYETKYIHVKREM